MVSDISAADTITEYDSDFLCPHYSLIQHVMKTLFVSGTDTEVGKTWISCQILRQLRLAGHKVGAWKPVCSGAIERNGALAWEDVDQLIDAIGGNPSESDLINRVCPQRFTAPLAPNIAARLEGRRVGQDVLAGGLGKWRGHADLVIAEGAGGLLSPASDEMLVADLIAELQTPLLLVAANKLGTIHHTLATVEAARSRKLKLTAIILNQVTADVDSTLTQSNQQELERLLPDITIFSVRHTGDICAASQGYDFTSWFEAPGIS